MPTGCPFGCKTSWLPGCSDMDQVLSDEFAEFAALADFQVGVLDGLESTWNRGGEIRFSISVADEIEVRSIEREGDPLVELRTDSSAVAERYLTAQLGSPLRSLAGLEGLLFLSAVGDFSPADGYAIHRASPGYALVETRTGHTVGVFAQNISAAQYSFYADAPLDPMRESFRTPQGDPLFRDAWQRWQGAAS